ncbi:MTRF1L release factor glutamine methyltransferase isoform X2 [Bufo gargarizans]|uniref:MTRF1L release factor glutamine methyltransferase isoform X2 n=1 Tax=Bufo gargarizans TaxID=30331 RepID=UPI001CF31506|nr:MTRF1L release factor glutamine methyltransferase isoform X2 [Bufo gargarizans]
MHLPLRRLLTTVTHRPVPCRKMGATGVTPYKLASYWGNVFHEHGIPEPHDSSRILVAHALGAKTLHSIGSHAARSPLSADQLLLVQNMAQERLKRVPVQYIIGEWDFLDMTLEMRPPVLIPRPETEELVGLVVADCEDLRHSTDASILEVGCGSGAVSLALLRRIPQVHVIAIDKSEAAVSLTRDNAERLGLQHRIHVLQHDILTDPVERLQDLGPVSAVVSNPPYIFTEDMPRLEAEVLRYEDHSALDGGLDGMDVMKGILLLAPLLLKARGDVFLEGDPRHPEMVKNWLEDHPEGRLRLLQIVKDFCGKPRFIHLRSGRDAANATTSHMTAPVSPLHAPVH